MDSVLTISSNMPIWTVYVTIVLGLISCFLGYKFLKVWMALLGFIIGMTIGYLVSYKYFDNVVIPIIIGFLLGTLIGFIAYRIYLIGVFIMVLAATLTFLGQLLAYFSEPGWVWLILTVVLGIIVASLALKFVKPVIIISSSLNGAVMVMSGIFKILKVDVSHVMLLTSLLLAILGIMVQFFTNKKSNHEE